MPNKSEREYRAMRMAVRSAQGEDDAEMTVEGYATTFNQPYVLYEDRDVRVEEEIDAHAFDACDMSDVIMQYDHQGRVFARNKNGTLAVAADDHGLKMTARLGGTEIGRQLYQEIKGGYTDRMSFGFIVGLDERTVTEDTESKKRIVRRKILKIRKLYDVSAVSIPANDATVISARSLLDGWIEEAKRSARAAQRRRLALKIRLMEGAL